MSIENKLNVIKTLFSAGWISVIMGCSSGVPSDVRNEIERDINIGMSNYGYGYLTYAKSYVYDKKGHEYDWYTTGAGGKKISNTQIWYTLVIKGDKGNKTVEYSLKIDLQKNRIIKIKRK